MAVEGQDATYRARQPELVLTRALGSRVWDVENREYIDLSVGFGALPFGHNSLPFQSVLKSYVSAESHPPIEHGMGDVYASQAKVEFIETLVGLMSSHAPQLRRASLALTGSQAVEIALKTAILKTNRTSFVCFDGGYHGVDLGVLPVTWRQDFKAPFTKFLSPAPMVSLPFLSTRKQLETGFESLGADQIAAVIVEPIQGRGGVVLPSEGWLSMVGEVCHGHGALLILDEVFVGLGRAGRWTFAGEANCDLLCLGKALGGGMPLSACMGTEAAMNAWPECTGEALHTGTFFGHPLSCEVGRQTLIELRRQDLPQRATVLGQEALSYLRQRASGSKRIREVRGQGLMLAIEGTEDGWGAMAMDQLRGVGIIALASGFHGRCISFSPALNIDRELLLGALKRVGDLLA